MKKLSFLIIIGVVLGFTGCTKKDDDSAFKNMIVGNWMVVGDGDIPISVEWGFFYVGSVRLYPNNSFAVNVPPAADSNNTFKIGTWKLQNNHSTIIFYSVMTDLGTVRRDTTEFKISIDPNGKLVLENDQNLIRHKRIE